MIPVITLLAAPTLDLSHLTNHPRYAQYQEARAKAPRVLNLNQMDVRWSSDGSTAYLLGIGDRLKVLETGATAERLAEGEGVPPRPTERRPPRATSLRSINSPNGEITLISDGFNFGWREGAGSTTWLTTEGSHDSRFQWGAVPWVYGEEWGETKAFNWAPDGKNFWVTRFDNSPVKPMPFVGGWTELRQTLRFLDYPKAGEPNPVASLHLGQYPNKGLRKIFEVAEPEFAYLFDVQWLPTGDLIFQTANRLQSVRRVHLVPKGGDAPKVIWEESVPDGYVPSGWKPVWVQGRLLVPTENRGNAQWAIAYGPGAPRLFGDGKLEVGRIIGSTAERLFFTASGGENPSIEQVISSEWSTGKSITFMSGSQDSRAWISPNGRWMMSATQSDKGQIIWRRAQIKIPFAHQIMQATPPYEGPRAQRVPFTAADGKTPLSLSLHLPPNAQGPVPLIVFAYAGPETSDLPQGIEALSPITSLGWAVARIETRGGLGRGQAFRLASYGKLGITEVDDLAAGVNHLVKQGWIDPKRVGITGTSYGGYATAMALARYPDVFSAGVAGSSVVDWRQYDTIYTERYMGLPQTSQAAYDAGSVATYARQLKGDLLLFVGMVDDNVHPSNTMQLVSILNQAGRYPTLIVAPNEGHSGPSLNATLAFFARSFAR